MVLGIIIGIGCGLLIYFTYILIVTLIRKHKEKKTASKDDVNNGIDN